jgi:hypothetical protein
MEHIQNENIMSIENEMELNGNESLQTKNNEEKM